MSAPTQNVCIYLVMLKVKPTPQHQLYFEIEYGVLSVWLLDQSDEGAVDHAEAILKHLPYEIVGEMRGVKRIEEPSSLLPRDEQQLENVKSVGLALFLAAAAVGVEDIDFDKMLEEWSR